MLSRKKHKELLFRAYRGRMEVNIISGHYDTSLEDCKRAIPLAVDRNATLEMELFKADIYLKGNFPVSAALSITHKFLDTPGSSPRLKAKILNIQGMCFFLQGDLADAKTNFQQSLIIYESLNDLSSISGIHNNLGAIHFRHFKLDLAEREFMSAANAFNKIGDLLNEAKAIKNIANIYSRKGEWEKALKMTTEYLHLSRRIGYVTGIANSYNDLGLINISLRNYAEAEHYILQYLSLAEKLNVHRHKMNAYLSLGLIHELKNDFVKARKEYLKAYKLSIKYSLFQGEGLSLLSLIGMDILQSRFNHTEARITRSLKIIRKLDDPVREAKLTLLKVKYLAIRQRFGECRREIIMLKEFSSRLNRPDLLEEARPYIEEVETKKSFQ